MKTLACVIACFLSFSIIAAQDEPPGAYPIFVFKNVEKIVVTDTMNVGGELSLRDDKGKWRKYKNSEVEKVIPADPKLAAKVEALPVKNSLPPLPMVKRTDKKVTQPEVHLQPTAAQAVIAKRFKKNLKEQNFDQDGTITVDATMPGNFTSAMIRGSMSTQTRDMMGEIFGDTKLSSGVTKIIVRYFGKVQNTLGQESEAMVAVYSLPTKVGKTVVWDNIYSETKFIRLLRTQGGSAGFMLKEFEFKDNGE